MNESAAATAKETWTVLRMGGYDSGGLEIPTISTGISTPAGPVRLALGPNGEPRVLLPLKDREAPATPTALASIAIGISALTHNGRPSRFLDLTCLSHDLETVFGEVVDEMLARITAGASCVSAANSTIEDFRSLLMRTSGREVEVTTVAGLIGELLILNRLLDRASSSWRAWRGPTGDRHDFRTGSTSLEVKTTLRSSTPVITIHGLEQLEPPSGGSLHLIRLVLEPVNGGILSISSLARGALNKADDPERLRGLISAIGCDDFDAPDWNHHSFRLESETVYEVRPGFPRLTSSMLTTRTVPAGVSGVSYQIDLSLATPFILSPDAFSKIEQELSECH